MSYKVKHENEHSFIVQHPDGSHFTVAKKGLSPSTTKKIQKLFEGGKVQDTDEKGPVSKDTANEFAKGLGVEPDEKEAPKKKESKVKGYDEGGFVKSPMDDPNAIPGGPATGGLPPGSSLEDIDTTSERTLNPTIDKSLQGLGMLADLIAPTKEDPSLLTRAVEGTKDLIAPKNPNYVAPKAPEQASGMPSESPTMPATASGEDKTASAMADALKNPMEGSYEMLQSGINQEQEAQSKLGTRQETELNRYIKQAEGAQKAFEGKRAMYTEARDKAFNEAMEGKVDPNHYWTTQSTAGKVSSIIGLILGGIGGGMQGTGGNVALEMLNKQIDRDIEAQKANLGQKNNLYKFNLERLKDEDEAYAVTRNQMAAMSGAQLQLASAKSQDPMAKARATQALGQLKQQYDVYNHNLALQKAAMSGSDPVTAKIGLLLPKEQHAEAFKELGEHNSKQRALAQVDSIMDDLNKLQTTSSRVGSPFQSSARIAQAKAALVQTVMEASPSKRLTKESVEQEIDPFVTRFLEDPGTRAAGRNRLKDIIRTNAAATPILSGRGWLPQDRGPIRTGAPVLKK